jgi:uncharacterized protein (DUF697 family)
VVDASKPWWLSKTIVAVLAILLVQLFAVFGLTLTEGDAQSLVESVRSVVTGVLAVVAIWGRVTAKQKIG